ncbi:MAG: hypothetical protein KDC92_08245 [Bacteroidetes bacterium]|nr:hypothetical protein [Bacteroidota bacterium]
MKLSDEFKVGVFATFAIAVLIVGFNYLKGRDLFANNITLTAKYENLSGLAPGNAVLYYGDQIGKVIGKTRQYDEKSKPYFIVSMSVTPEAKIPKGSVAKIISPIMASKAIEIVPSNSPEFVVDDDQLKSTIDYGLMPKLEKTAGELEEITNSLKTTIANLGKTLDNETQDDIKISIKNIKNTSESLGGLIQRTSDNLGGIMSDFKSASSSVKETSGKLSSTVENVNAISDSLRNTPIKSTVEDVKAAVASLQGILLALDNGEGTLGQLLNDPTVYNNLDATIRELEKLAKDIQAHPKHYLAPLGKKERKDWAKPEPNE